MQHIRQRNQVLVLIISLMLVTAACGDGAGPATTSAPPATAAPTTAAPITTTTTAASTAEPTRQLCQPSDPACIGPLAPGTHTTARLLIPVTFEVPEGWSKTLDVPGSLELVLEGFPSGTVGIRPDWAIADQERCTSNSEPGLGRTVDDLVSFLTEHPGLITSTPEPVILGGLEGQRLDVRKDLAWSGPCPGRVSLFTHQGTINDPGWWDIYDYWQFRLYFLDAGDDHTVTVHIDTTDEASFEGFVGAAMPIVEAFQFGATP